MPACEDRSLLIGGLIDGELDAANTVMLERDRKGRLRRHHPDRCEERRNDKDI